MGEECPLSCARCTEAGTHQCFDDDRCAGWAKEEHCHRNRRFMALTCRRACGWCAAVDDASAGQGECTDEDIKCETWACQGECSRNPSFMRGECARSCKACVAAPTPPASSAATGEPCVDKFKDCASMSRAPDGCAARFMTRNCRATCNLCDAGGARVSSRLHDEL